MARKDHAEADRLADTCERTSYKMQDAAYLQNLQYIHMSCLYALLSISEAELRAAAAAASMLLAKAKDLKRNRYLWGPCSGQPVVEWPASAGGCLSL